jgi:hypothetical protein
MNELQMALSIVTIEMLIAVSVLLEFYIAKKIITAIRNMQHSRIDKRRHHAL